MSETEKDSDKFMVDLKGSLPSQDNNLGFPEPGSRERALAEKRLVKKLDIRLLPTIILIFIMNYIDVRATCDLNRLVG